MFFRKAQQTHKKQGMAGVEYLIAGLGNPGINYAYTRHNAGFLALDRIAELYGARVNTLKFQSLCATASIEGKKALLLKPQTFMNLSGQAVTAAMSFYKLPPERVVLLFDDISLDVGRVRIRRSGSDGGHNGIKNILYLSGSDAFPRVKLGVGKKPRPEMDLADWVLSRFSKDEGEALEQAIEKAADAVRLIVCGEIEEAMNRYNS